MELKLYAGVYKQEDYNSFVIKFQFNSLFLETAEGKLEKLVPIKDHLFQIENTKSKINFIISPNNLPYSLEFILPDRKTLAHKEIMGFEDETPTAKGLGIEITIGLGILLVLFGILLGGHQVWVSKCMSGSKPFCLIASASSVILNKKTQTKQMIEQNEETSFKHKVEKFKDKCENKDPEACFHYAHELKKMGNMPLYETILNINCSNLKHFNSCKAFSQYYKFKGNKILALETLTKSCTTGLGASCFEVSHQYTRSGDQILATKYLNLGCELEDDKSCTDIGFQIQLEQSQKALSLFEKACENRFKPACQGKEDLKQFILNKNNCQNNNGESCYQMSQFINRFGNKKQAIDLVKKSCRLKTKQACQWLAKRKITL